MTGRHKAGAYRFLGRHKAGGYRLLAGIDRWKGLPPAATSISSLPSWQRLQE
jgi:hypothetical protein